MTDADPIDRDPTADRDRLARRDCPLPPPDQPPRADNPRRDAVTATNPDDFLRRLGKRIRLARLTREWTQEQLGELSGMSRNFISMIEHGACGVDVVRLLRVADALRVPLADLLTDGDPTRQP
jgi:ribosome-binding protein aMBF1 (putative translation factor)